MQNKKPKTKCKIRKTKPKSCNERTKPKSCNERMTCLIAWILLVEFPILCGIRKKAPYCPFNRVRFLLLISSLWPLLGEKKNYHMKFLYTYSHCLLKHHWPLILISTKIFFFSTIKTKTIKDCLFHLIWPDHT